MPLKCSRGRVQAPEHRFYPCYQFSRTERLGHVVVATQFQTEDAVDFIIPGRQENDRCVEECLRIVAADFGTVHLGHENVEHHEIRFVRLECP